MASLLEDQQFFRAMRLGVYDDVTYVYDDVTYVHDDVT